MKMEIELTEDQAKKVESLKENGIDIGEAIDLLFEMQEEAINSRIERATREKAELEEKLSKVNDELSFFDKMKDSSLDSSQKQKIVEKEYGKIDETYDKTVHDAKLKFKWTRLL